MLCYIILYHVILYHIILLQYSNLRRAGAGEVDVPRRRVPGEVVALPPPEAGQRGAEPAGHLRRPRQHARREVLVLKIRIACYIYIYIYVFMY